MTDRYFLSVPGSDDPPKGPYTPDEIERELLAGSAPNTALVCKVGGTTWSPVATVVLARRPLPVPAAETVAVGTTLEPRRYKNLESVAGSLSGVGRMLQVLSVVLLVGGVLGALYAYSGSPLLAFSLVGTTILALPVYAIGVLIAAGGEALLALRDIAVHTRPTVGGAT